MKWEMQQPCHTETRRICFRPSCTRVHAIVGEGLIYFPARGRKPWGENTGARAELHARNANIRAEAAQGASLEALSRRYHLAPSTLRHILRRKR